MPTTTPKPFVFVLMPFDEDFDDVYQLGIKAACEEAGAYCERLDEQIFQDSMLQRIYNQINKADVIVADMTGRNPNVFYEVGYAHALGKTVILLTEESDDIPFDLKHRQHIVYKGRVTDLKEKLVENIEWALSEPDETLAGQNMQFRFLDIDYARQFVACNQVINPFVEVRNHFRSFFFNRIDDLEGAAQFDIKVDFDPSTRISEFESESELASRRRVVIEADECHVEYQFNIAIRAVHVWDAEGNRIYTVREDSHSHGTPDLNDIDFHPTFFKTCRVHIEPKPRKNLRALLRDLKERGVGQLFAQEYNGVGASEEQFLKLFRTQNIDVVYKHEIETKVPYKQRFANALKSDIEEFYGEEAKANVTYKPENLTRDEWLESITESDEKSEEENDPPF